MYERGEYAQAVVLYRKHLGQGAEDGRTHYKLARALFYLGEADQAVAHWRAAIGLGDELDSRLSLAVVAPGCPGIDPAEILELRRDVGRLLAERVPPFAPRAALRGATRPLRLGYVSAFFDKPHYMKPVWPLIHHHDRNRFEVHLFSDQPAATLAGYRPHDSDHVHETAALGTVELAQLIREQDIDVLVDLNGYSRTQRLALFAHRPAPVTIAWFNMYATSGLPGLQYVVGDEQVVSGGEEVLFTEKILRLPQSYLTYQVDYPVPDVEASPCLKNGFVTFGSLVSQYKITPLVLDAWSEILRRADGSRLLLRNDTLGVTANQRYLLDGLAERGVDPERVTLRGRAPHFEFLRSYAEIDIALDAFPYNGGTTTMEALWQGVPVVTFHGDRWASRTSSSILRATHLSELVAEDVPGYVDMAVGLAQPRTSWERLAELRRTMRTRLRASRACDAATMASAMEKLYAEAWTAAARAD